MYRFFYFFAKRNRLAYLFTLIVIIMGLLSLTTIKRDSFPEVAFGELLITTNYPGASPEDVELRVTNKIEKEIEKVPGIKRFMSWSMENVSTIRIVIDPDVDSEDKVIRDIRDAISRVKDLPREVVDSPLVSELGTSEFTMIEIGMAGDVPYFELRELARRLEIKLKNLQGVAKVDRFGYRAREVRIEAAPKVLEKKEISLNQILSAIKERNIRSSGGSFESYTSEKNIVTLAQFRQPQDVGDVIVRASVDGPIITIKDLAVVNDEFVAEKVMSRINGTSAISFVAHKASNADIIRTVDDIRALVEEEKNFLPQGVEILISNDKSTYVRNRLSIVITNGLMGLCLVMLVLVLFLNLRTAFWVGVGIPVTILGVIFILPMFNIFLDSVTMTAIVLVIGIVVDDAIIIAENIYQKAEDGLSPIEAASQGVSEVFRPVGTTVLTTLIVFAPLFFMPGMLGKFVYVIPLVICLALVVSLAESTLALPAHLVLGLGRNKKKQDVSFKKSGFMWLRRIYMKVISTLLCFRYLLVLMFILVLGGALAYASKYMDFVLFPSSMAERIIVLIETPVGSSLDATSDRTKQVEAIVSELGREELDSFVTRIGTFGNIGASERENSAAVLVYLTPYATRERTADEIVTSLRYKSDKLEGFDKINYIIDSGGPPVGRPIMMRVVGNDDVMRKRLADDLVQYLKTVDGAKDIDRDDKAGKNQLEIKLDYEKMARVGVSVANIAQNVRVAIDGEVVTSVRYNDEDVDFRVIFSKTARKNLAHLRRIGIPNAGGRLTPLGKFARFDTSSAPGNIHHYNGDRAITISGDVDKNITTPLKVSKLVQAYFNNTDHRGMRLVIGGEAEESQSSLIELFSILGIAVIGIYFLLTLLFNSFWQPIMVMMAIPFGIIGVIVGFSVHSESVGFLAMTGIIGLTGVVVNDSLVLVNHVNELRKSDLNCNLRDIVALGTADRLRAILLTTLSTIVGLFPLAYSIGGSDPYMGPLAMALAWGLLFAMPLTLVLLPCLYLIFEDIGNVFVRAVRAIKCN